MKKAEILPQTRDIMWRLIMAYAMIITIANWFDARLIQLVGFNTDAGTLIFPFSFLISDLITEVYGYKRARQAIRIGLVFNISFLLYAHLVTVLPSPSYAPLNHLYDAIMTTNTRVVMASYISYLVSEPLNAMMLARLKVATQGRWMALRFVLSTVVATFIDNALFNGLLFAGTLSWTQILDLAYGTWVIKVAVEVLGLPLSMTAARWLKRKEGIDIYDHGTNYALWRLDNHYDKID